MNGLKIKNLIMNETWAILPTTFDTLWHAEHFLWPSSTETEALLSNPQNKGALRKLLPARLPVSDKDPKKENVAVLPVTGLILPTENLFSLLLGATTLDTFACDFQHALDNPAVSAIIFTIDSPGGSVTGVHECAEMIYQARGKKPIIAYISGLGASAAYWLASSADEIIVDATASVGSIGVLSVHTDDTAQKAQKGLVQTHIVSSQSPRKRLGVATEAGRADLQAHVDAIAEVFVENVARNRNVSVASVLADFGQGSLCVGMHAVKQNMADRIGSFAQLIQEKTEKAAVATTPFHPPQREKSMTELLPTASAPPITVDYLMEHHAHVAQAIQVIGAQQEHARIQAVEAQSMPGHEALIHALKSDGKTSGRDAAVLVLAAEKARQAETLALLKANAPPPLPIASSVTEALALGSVPKKTLSLEETWKANWQNDSALQSEFGCFETYQAFMRADANGQIHVLSRSEK